MNNKIPENLIINNIFGKINHIINLCPTQTEIKHGS